MKKNYKITSVNIISEGWTQFALIPGFVFMSGKTVLKKFTFQARADNSSDPSNIILIMSSTKRTYHLRLNKLLEGASFVNLPELVEKNDIELYKSIDSLPRILKNQELYEDMNYFQ